MMPDELYRKWVGALRRDISRMGLADWGKPGMDDPVAEARSETDLRTRISDVVLQSAEALTATAEEKRRAVEDIFNAMRRMDVLEPLLRDPATTEVMVNGPAKVFVERNGRVELTSCRFESRERLEELIHHLVSRVNRSVNESEPIVDARLPDGSRMNAVLPPVSLDGPLLTIRRFPERPIDMEWLVGQQALSREAAAFLAQLVRARYNLFVCGGTGSGKTTFLNVLSAFIPREERIVTMEDSAELRLVGVENLARLETRNPNSEGRGEITMKQLIRASLRMRPDRIIVGEVRGEEAFDMLQAMNTGHDGSMSTGHANSAPDMMRRLETMVSLAVRVPLSVIRRQIASALDVVVFMQRLRDHTRRIVEISEVVGCGEEEILLAPLFVFQEMDVSGASSGLVSGRLVRTGCPLSRTDKLKLRGLTLPTQGEVDSQQPG